MANARAGAIAGGERKEVMMMPLNRTSNQLALVGALWTGLLSRDANIHACLGMGPRRSRPVAREAAG